MACPLARLIKLVLNGFADEEVVVILIVSLGFSVRHRDQPHGEAVCRHENNEKHYKGKDLHGETYLIQNNVRNSLLRILMYHA